MCRNDITFLEYNISYRGKRKRQTMMVEKSRDNRGPRCFPSRSFKMYFHVQTATPFMTRRFMLASNSYMRKYISELLGKGNTFDLCNHVTLQPP